MCGVFRAIDSKKCNHKIKIIWIPCINIFNKSFVGATAISVNWNALRQYFVANCCLLDYMVHLEVFSGIFQDLKVGFPHSQAFGDWWQMAHDACNVIRSVCQLIDGEMYAIVCICNTFPDLIVFECDSYHFNDIFLFYYQFSTITLALLCIFQLLFTK